MDGIIWQIAYPNSLTFRPSGSSNSTCSPPSTFGGTVVWNVCIYVFLERPIAVRNVCLGIIRRGSVPRGLLCCSCKDGCTRLVTGDRNIWFRSIKGGGGLKCIWKIVRKTFCKKNLAGRTATIFKKLLPRNSWNSSLFMKATCFTFTVSTVLHPLGFGSAFRDF